ncbi:hypothetical protein NITHO_2400004 [Nitrolancea hollandica Lb]|uniref:Uncharacterized protein n=1 Tax=Nitrolancea hollandica Lb TaxID=1129897 RepID=I4EFT2_9BACT|nr:hypothetical protein NITHO_2400004 [Nitrolancea hollandica Lb]
MRIVDIMEPEAIPYSQRVGFTQLVSGGVYAEQDVGPPAPPVRLRAVRQDLHRQRA